MKKVLILTLSVLLFASSCSTNTTNGAYTGGQFGYVIGSAIGGLTGGWRGHDKGALIGTIGGVVAGAAIGSAIDRAQQRKYENDNRNYDDRRSADNRSTTLPDDRIYMMPQEAALEIRNATIIESLRDGYLTRGEECTVTFEIFNTSDDTIYDIYPLVEDATGNKHVNISPNLRIESIRARQGVRYTATILADKKLKNGEIIIRMGVAQGKNEVVSQRREFKVTTAKNPVQ